MGNKKRNPNLPWEMTREELEAHIAERFSHWDDIYENGCNDPSWADGVNLNLVRNHILFAYRYMDGMDTGEEQLDLFSTANTVTERRPPPPEVDNNYMAVQRTLAGSVA